MDEVPGVRLLALVATVCRVALPRTCHTNDQKSIVINNQFLSKLIIKPKLIFIKNCLLNKSQLSTKNQLLKNWLLLKFIFIKKSIINQKLIVKKSIIKIYFYEKSVISF